MGFLADIKKEQCYLGEEIKSAYFSIDEIEIVDSVVRISVCGYLSRDAKKSKDKMIKLAKKEPVYLQTSEETQQKDIASFTSIAQNPYFKITMPVIFEYTIEIDANIIQDKIIPFQIDTQKSELYKEVKRLLGFENAQDVFENILVNEVKKDEQSASEVL